MASPVPSKRPPRSRTRKTAPTASQAAASAGAASREAAAKDAAARLARRERRRQHSREEIIAGARRVLLREGIAATTLEAVAREVGLTKAALYYYYPSKDALLFDVVFGTIEGQAHAIHDAVEGARDGGEALRAIIRETVSTFASRLDDFRLVYMHGQVASPGTVKVTPEQLARVRPLNDLSFAGAASRLADERRAGRLRVKVEPRLLAFLASVSALGILTMKGLVESVGDPLLYSDAELVEGLARVFEAAARG